MTCVQENNWGTGVISFCSEHCEHRPLFDTEQCIFTPRMELNSTDDATFVQHFMCNNQYLPVVGKFIKACSFAEVNYSQTSLLMNWRAKQNLILVDTLHWVHDRL